mmetsp:Transcript_23130/g.38708  ORF Transcript_23130/g.38708 Transcript_23130/m.38708 type:complete len:357 (+) Transcript_23130:211-1281(+)
MQCACTFSMNMAARSSPAFCAMSMFVKSSAISCWSISPSPAISAIVLRGFLEVSSFLRRSAGAARAFTFASMKFTKSCVAWSMPSTCSLRLESGKEFSNSARTNSKNCGVREGRTRVISNSSSLISESSRYWRSSGGSEGIVRLARNSSSSALSFALSSASSSSFAFFAAISLSFSRRSMMLPPPNLSSSTASGKNFSGSQSSSRERSSFSDSVSAAILPSSMTVPSSTPPCLPMPSRTEPSAPMVSRVISTPGMPTILNASSSNFAPPIPCPLVELAGPGFRGSSRAWVIAPARLRPQVLSAIAGFGRTAFTPRRKVALVGALAQSRTIRVGHTAFEVKVHAIECRDKIQCYDRI